MAQTWMKLAVIFNKAADQELVVAKVDCSLEGDLCSGTLAQLEKCDRVLFNIFFLMFYLILSKRIIQFRSIFYSEASRQGYWLSNGLLNCRIVINIRINSVNKLKLVSFNPMV